MSTEEKIIMGKNVVGFCIGWTVGTMLKTYIHPYCNGFEKVITTVGGCGIAWGLNELASKPYYAACDELFHTELVEELDL